MKKGTQIPNREAALKFLLRVGASRASELPSFLGISVQTLRHHLRNFQEDGLEGPTSMSCGPGRSSNISNLTFQSKSFFNSGNSSEQFAVELLSAINTTPSSETINELLNDQFLQNANEDKSKIGSGSLNLDLEKLVEIRDKEGYSYELNCPKPLPIRWNLSSFYSSILSIAEKYRLVYDQELKILSYIFLDYFFLKIKWRLDTDNFFCYQISPNC